jgi:hypothetical protein
VFPRVNQGDQMPPSYHYVTIACPETGNPITVAKNTRDDPVGRLYTSNQISEHQRRAAEAYQNDHEAMAGRLRAHSRGPRDISGWKGRRSDGNHLRKPGDRLKRAHERLGPEASRLIRGFLIDGHPLPRNRVRELGQALDELAEAYGLPAPTRH